VRSAEKKDTSSMAPHIFLPQHRRQLRRRYNPNSNIGSVKSRTRGCCNGMRPTCIIAGIVFLFTFIFASTFRQNQSDWIKLDNLSTTINTDANTSPTTTTTTSKRSFEVIESTGDETNLIEEKTKPPSLSLSNLPPCDDDCQIHRRQRLDQSGGMNLLDVADMISSVQAKKQALLDLLGDPNQYGDLASKLFETYDTPSGKHQLSSQLLEALDAKANPSRERLRDKVQAKVLQAQLEIIRQDNRPTAAAIDAAYRARAAQTHTDKTDAAAAAAAAAESVGFGSSNTAAAATESEGYDSSVQDNRSSSSPIHNEQRMLRRLSETEQQVETDEDTDEDTDTDADTTDADTTDEDTDDGDTSDEDTTNEDTDPFGMDKNDEEPVSSSKSISPPSPQVPYKFTQTRFVWATAGDGAAAGHGNLAKESYTAILEQAAGPVFGAAGIELTTRNYGWAGATDKSAPELALCLDSVYGTDVDILAWDFEESASQSSQHSQQERQQREREHGWKRHMFWARAALQANRPAVVAMNLNNVHAYVQGGSSDSHPHFARAGRARCQWSDSTGIQSRRHGAYPQEHYSRCHRLVARRGR
jgi:hypothetical protein